MLRQRRTIAAAVLGVLALPVSAAHAGRRMLAWAYDSETLPAHGVELEQWVSESTGGPEPNTYNVFWAVNLGLTDELEVSLPIDWFWVAGGGVGAVLQDYGADIKWRLVTSDPARAPLVAPLIRLGVRRLLAGAQRDNVRLDGDFVLTTDVIPRVHAVLDANLDVITDSATDTELNVLLGASIAVTDEIRLGGTGWWNEDLHGDNSGQGWLAAGPDLSWTHGHFWFTGSLMFGLTGGTYGAPGVQGRVAWGVIF